MLNFAFVFKLLLGFIVFTLVYNLYLVVRYFRFVKFAWTVNKVWIPSFPVIGSAYIALFVKQKMNVLSSLLFCERHLGIPLTGWHGGKFYYLSNNAEETRIILNHPKCYNKFELYNSLHWIFRNSLLIVPDEIWKPRRRYFRTAFKSNMIKNFYPTFNHQSCLLIEKIEHLTSNEDLFKFFNKYAFMNYFLTAVGMDIENANPEIERFGALTVSVQEEFAKLLVVPFIPIFIWIRTPLGAKLKSELEEMKNILRIVVMERQKLCASIPEYVNTPTDIPFIDLLLSEAYQKNNETDLFEEFTLFAGAATDTTGHTLAFCFTLLGMHPEQQQRVYEEVMSSIGDRTIDTGNIQHLKYTEAVICESMRMLPPIPFYGRWCAEDIDLGTKVIPKGVNFIVSAYHMHRHPDYWENPLKYDPTRFLPENASKIVPGSYLPFSAGPRNCIGQGLAMVLLKITVANVVRAYRITSRHKSIEEFDLESCISMKTSHRLDCNFIPRTQN